MSGAKYIFGMGLVVFGSQLYHSYRKSREDRLKEIYDENVDKASLLKKIHNEIASKWKEEMDSYEWAKRIDKYRKVLCSYAEGRVLELGIGIGRNWNYYHAGCKVTGVDWSSEMLKVCEDINKEKVKHYSLLEADARSLPFSDASFDSVVCTFLLSSTLNQDLVLQEAARVLKPKGKMLVLDYGKPSSLLTSVHLELYRYTYIFKYGYDQCLDIHSFIKNSSFKIDVSEKKQGGQVYFYILTKE